MTKSDSTAPGSLLDTLPARLSDAPLRWARETPDAWAVADGAQRLTHAAFGAAIEAVAWRLRAHGVRPGDRVAVLMENGVTAAALIHGASLAGAVISPINARIAPREVAVMTGHLDARCILYTLDSPAAAEHAEQAGAVAIDVPEAGRFAITALRDCEPEGADAPALVMFTSGTTGQPKGVMLSHRAILYQAASQVLARRITAADVLYIVAPFSHTIGLGSNLVTAGIAGAEAVLAPRFDPDALAHAIAEGRITFMVAVPQVYAKLLDHAEAKGIPLGRGRLRVTATGGAPVDLTLKARMQATFGLPFGNGYGMTEMTPIARVPDDMDASGDEIGIPAPGGALRITRPDGTEAATGEIGEIWARGPSRMDGYFRDAEATRAAVTPEGWLRTGDLGMRDARGAFTIVGRSKELIIRSGFNVYPVEVEGVLNAFPGVAQSAVVGRRVPGNEEVLAYVQPAVGAALDVEALRAHCRANLAGYKVPAEIVLGELPIGPTGKILKSALARRAAA
jgi:acyl-CoA synthetase (AMP-forming)/AMP-acid ligase II